jgi:CRP/FNR family transcriptional regulator, cyclic AMP receptor protein
MSKTQTSAMRIWRGAALFDGAGDAALQAIAAASTSAHWNAGEMIFHRGDVGDSVIGLATGRVKLSLVTRQGRELVLRHAEPGDFLGELAFLDPAPRSADATAMENTTGFILRRVDFDRLADRQLLVSKAAVYLCQRLRDTTDQLESIALYGLSSRLARFFLLTLRQINGDDLPPAPRLRLPLTQSELAAILGASRPKVNRAIAELELAGAIKRVGTILECDPDLLEAFADPAGLE